MRDRPSRPATSTEARGTPVQLPCTIVADTAGPSTYQKPSMSTPHGPSTAFPSTGYVGFTTTLAPGPGPGPYLQLYCAYLMFLTSDY